jgi:hypothetical protein
MGLSDGQTELVASEQWTRRGAGHPKGGNRNLAVNSDPDR